MKFNFWEDWPISIKVIFFLLAFLSITCATLVIFYDVQGVSTSIDWEIIGTRSPMPVEALVVESGPYTFPLHVENFTINELYRGGELRINHFAYYFFLLAAATALIVGITISTFLERIPYIVVTAIIVVVLLFFKFENILLFGWSDNTALILIVLTFVGLSYVFNALRPDIPFLKRLQTFMLLTIGWSVLIFFFSGIAQPFLMLGASGFLITYLIGIIFILMVSPEIIHFIVVAVSTSSSRTGNSLLHFTIFTLVYLGSILMMFLHDTHVIEWNLYYLNPYILIVISSVLGLWGLQTRRILLDGIVPYYPFLVFLYMVMCIFCLGTTMFFLGTTNDPILQVVKDAIIYSHLGFGFIFFIYIISNFMGMLKNNLNAGHVIYKPKNMPHFTFRFAGLILVTAFFLKENIEVPIYHTISGMFNNMGDYYASQNESYEAETNYENGRLYGYMNHKSNYALGKINENSGDFPAAIEYYSNATRVRPSPMSFVNLSAVQTTTGDFFNGLFMLSDGQKLFPSDPAILNNKGHMFNQISVTDSAILYYDASYRSGDRKHASVANYLDLLAHKEYDLDIDSLLDVYGSKNFPAVTINELAFRNISNNSDPFNNVWPMDSSFNLYSSSFWSNYLTNQHHHLDTSTMNYVEALVRSSGNESYSAPAGLNLAIAMYIQGYVFKAIELLRYLAASSTRERGKYYHTLGLLFMDLNDYVQALDFLDLSMASGYSEAILPRFMCMLKKGESERVEKEISDMEQTTFTGKAELLQLSRLVRKNPQYALQRGGSEKYNYLHYNMDRLDQNQRDQLFLSISEHTRYYEKATFDLARQYFKEGQYGLAESYLSKLEFTNDRTIILFLDLLAAQKDLGSLKEESSKLEWLPDDRRYFYEALIALEANNLERTEQLFDLVSGLNPYQEEALLEAGIFFRDDEDLKSYNILVNAVLQNPNSIKLLKAYVDACLYEGLSSYAQSGLRALRELSEVEYQDYLRRNSDTIKMLLN